MKSDTVLYYRFLCYNLPNVPFCCLPPFERESRVLQLAIRHS